jgi:hypothetical protein
MAATVVIGPHKDKPSPSSSPVVEITPLRQDALRVKLFSIHRTVDGCRYSLLAQGRRGSVWRGGQQARNCGLLRALLHGRRPLAAARYDEF